MQFEYLQFVEAADYAADAMNKHARAGGWRTIAVVPRDNLKILVVMERLYQAPESEEPRAMGMRG